MAAGRRQTAGLECTWQYARQNIDHPDSEQVVLLKQRLQLVFAAFDQKLGVCAANTQNEGSATISQHCSRGLEKPLEIIFK